MQSEKAYAIAH